MIKDAIKNLGKPKHSIIDIGGSRVGVAKWSIGASERIEEVRKKYNDGAATYADYVCAVILETVCDEDGLRVFSDGDVQDIRDMDTVFVRDLFFACMKQNGINLSVADIEEAENEAGGTEKN